MLLNNTGCCFRTTTLVLNWQIMRGTSDFITCPRDFSLFQDQGTLDYRLSSVLSRNKYFPFSEHCILYLPTCKTVCLIDADIFIDNRYYLKFCSLKLLNPYLLLSDYSLIFSST